MSRFYGMGPDELMGLPVGVLRAYCKMLPVLEAHEDLRAEHAASIARTPQTNGELQNQKSARRTLARAAFRYEPKPPKRKGGKEATLAMIRMLGIPVEIKKRKNG